MFIDIAKIKIVSGKGGDGKVGFHREKYVAAGGPDGGDGGRGGSVIFKVDDNLSTLLDFRYKKKYVAAPGEPGGGKRCKGKDGADLIIRVPRGTIIRDQKTGQVMKDMSDSEPFVAAKGGNGGWGNTHFATPTRQAPRFAKPGLPGVERDIILELKLLADVGLVGFPNVGKSTLLSMVSAARPKIANYHFTTLVPNLGVVSVGEEQNFVMADIPGIIEGASEGKGLGHQFLRHIERTALIIHVVDITGGFEQRDPVEDYRVINEELKRYASDLASRPQIVVANKCDTSGMADRIAELKRVALADGHMFFTVSAVTGAGLNSFMLACGEQVAKQREQLASVDADKPEIDMDRWERQRLMRERRFRVVQEEEHAFRVVGRSIERLVIQTDWDNEDAVIYLQHKFARLGVDMALEKAGCRMGDEVRICGRAFDYEGADDCEDDVFTEEDAAYADSLSVSEEGE